MAVVPGRALTIIAVGFLALDGVLLGLAGWWTRQINLILAGVVLLLAAVGVLYLWKRQRKRLADITAARAALKAAAGELRGLIGRGNPGGSVES
jgi:LPXTG-motif cell wall-anchored protein